MRQCHTQDADNSTDNEDFSAGLLPSKLVTQLRAEITELKSVTGTSPKINLDSLSEIADKLEISLDARIVRMKKTADGLETDNDAKFACMTERADDLEKSNDAKFARLKQRADSLEQKNDTRYAVMTEAADSLEKSNVAKFAGLKHKADSLELENDTRFAVMTEAADSLEKSNAAKFAGLKHKADDLEAINEAKLDKLQLFNDDLLQQNKAFLKGFKVGNPQRQIHISTLGSKTLKLLQDLSMGERPDLTDVAHLQALLSASKNLWAPLDIEQEIHSHVNEQDVAESLIQLVGKTSSVLEKSEVPIALTQGTETGGCEVIKSLGLPRSITPEFETVIVTADLWCWDSFGLERATKGHALSALSFWILKTTGLIHRFSLDESRLAAFLRHIESIYGRNPYHNSTHAADVLQTVYKILTQDAILDHLGMLSSLLAAIVHDLQHTGHTNSYLISVSHWLATRSNDISPHENFHISRAFELIQEDRFNFLKHMGSDKENLRRDMIDMVLATDMKHHFSLLDNFRNSPRTRTLSQQLVIKVADIGHLAASWPVHLRWVNLLQEELFLQGDDEKAAGLKVSPMMNRSGKGVSKMQVEFFDVVAAPLFELLIKSFPSCAQIVSAMHSNYMHWKSLESTF